MARNRQNVLEIIQFLEDDILKYLLKTSGIYGDSILNQNRIMNSNLSKTGWGHSEFMTTLSIYRMY